MRINCLHKKAPAEFHTISIEIDIKKIMILKTKIYFPLIIGY